MSFYVKRTRSDGRISWTGPIRSKPQAEREVEAWQTCKLSSGLHYDAELIPSTAAVRAEVRMWERNKA